MSQTSPILFDIDMTLLNTRQLIDKQLDPATAQQLKINLIELAKRKENFKAKLDKYSDFNPK